MGIRMATPLKSLNEMRSLVKPVPYKCCIYGFISSLMILLSLLLLMFPLSFLPRCMHSTIFSFLWIHMSQQVTSLSWVRLNLFLLWCECEKEIRNWILEAICTKFKSCKWHKLVALNNKKYNFLLFLLQWIWWSWNMHECRVTRMCAV